MERKTTVQAIEGSQTILIQREFDIPVRLLFKAYTDASIVSQWMGTRVVQFDNRPGGSYRFETSGPDGNIAFSAYGIIHECTDNRKIVRTFEMENAGFDTQLEFLQFESLDNNRSRLIIHSIFKSVEMRDKQLKLPFAFGINMAHDRMEQILQSLK